LRGALFVFEYDYQLHGMAEKQGIGQQLIGSIPEGPKVGVVGKGNHSSTAHSLHLKGHRVGDQFRIDF